MAIITYDLQARSASSTDMKTSHLRRPTTKKKSPKMKQGVPGCAVPKGSLLVCEAVIEGCLAVDAEVRPTSKGSLYV